MLGALLLIGRGSPQQSRPHKRQAPWQMGTPFHLLRYASRSRPIHRPLGRAELRRRLSKLASSFPLHVVLAVSHHRSEHVATQPPFVSAIVSSVRPPLVLLSNPPIQS